MQIPGIELYALFLCPFTELTFTVNPTEAISTVTHTASFIQGPFIQTHSNAG